MKKVIAFLLAFSVAITYNLVSARASGEISAWGYVVMDSQTGRVLYEKNANSQHSMASTTKIMTALVALENGNLEDMVTITATSAGTEGSSIYLKVGDKVKLSDLLYGLMLQSGNDAAMAIGEYIGGSIENFATMMTEKARAIGAVNTSFKNPSGLDQEGHYTTAYDLALITRYALKNEAFANLVKTKSKSISWENCGWTRNLKNHNKMLDMYEGCDGVKTGYTKKTGRCLVSSATRNGWQVIVVTLNAPDDWNDHTKLLNQAFLEFQPQNLVSKGEVAGEISITDGSCDKISAVASDTFASHVKTGESLPFTIQKNIPAQLEAPIAAGTQVGEYQIYYNESLLQTIPIIITEDIDFVMVKTYGKSLRALLKSLLLQFNLNQT